MEQIAGWATLGLVVVTSLLVWATWQLRLITERSAAATEKTAHAALRQAELGAEAVEQMKRAAEATSEQAEISRRMLEVSVAPFLIPVTGEIEGTDEGRDVTRAPVEVGHREDAVVVTVVFRNFGSGPARIAGCNIVAANHSYRGRASPMVVGPGEESTMTAYVDAGEGVSDRYVQGRSSIESGRFRVAMSCWNLPQTTIYTTEIQLHPKTLTGLGPHQWDVKVIETAGEKTALIRTMLNEGVIPGIRIDDRRWRRNKR